MSTATDEQMKKEARAYAKSIEQFAAMNYGMLSVIEQGIPEETRIFLGDMVAELSDCVIDNAARVGDKQAMLYQTLLLQGAILEVLLEGSEHE